MVDADCCNEDRKEGRGGKERNVKQYIRGEGDRGNEKDKEKVLKL
jgi:hypothetical protein